MNTVTNISKKHLTPILMAIIGLIVFISACSSPPSPEMLLDVPEKPIVINLGLTSALTQYENAVKDCATDATVLVDVLPWVRLQDETEDVYLVYGEEGKELTEVVYQIGESPLVFIVHPDLPVDSLTLSQIQAIFNGTMMDWSERSITSSYMGEIQLWGYMDETEIMQTALDAIALPKPTGQWQVAPTPADVVDMVAQDQNAISVVPLSAVTDAVKTISIEGAEFNPVPILAIWHHEPTTKEQEWLLCVQAAME